MHDDVDRNAGTAGEAGFSSDVPPPTRNFEATRGILLVLLLVSLLLPLVCLAWYGYYAYQRRMSDAVAISERCTRVAEEQALKVMDLNAELASRVADLLADMSDSEIRAAEPLLHRKLEQVAGAFPQVDAINAFGKTGDLLVSSRFYPVPAIYIAKREDFIASRRYRPEPYVSLPMAAAISHEPVFNVAQARVAKDGAFLGTVSIALRREYLTMFYQKLTEEEDQAFIGLYRRSGALLASYPAMPLASPEFTSPSLVSAFAKNETAGHIRSSGFPDHQRRFAAYRRVGDYRLFVAAGFLTDQVFGRWLRHFLFITGLVSLPCLAIWALVGFSLRQVAAEQRSWSRWRDETTRRLQAEASGRQLQRMGALGNLVANVAHEFNNHLMAVKSNLEIVRRKCYCGVQPEADALASSTQGVEALVRTLMGATRTQALNVTHVDLGDALRTLSPIVQAAVGDAVRVTVGISPSVWPVKCDRAELELAVINLALNARDAMPEGGAFSVRAQNIAVTSHVVGVDAGDYVLLTASDDGTGMEQAVAERAFEPLFTTKAQTSAAGLGLTQVLAFCELSGGTARIASSPGAGTTVRLYLQRSPATVSASMTEPGQQPSSSLPAARVAPTSILLVEDNLEVAAGLSAVLEIMGHDVTHCESADDALRALQTGGQFGLVLSDVQMPGTMNGIDLAEWLKANRPHQTVALMTGYADELDRARRTGVPIFAKPFNVDELAPLIA